MNVVETLYSHLLPLFLNKPKMFYLGLMSGSLCVSEWGWGQRAASEERRHSYVYKHACKDNGQFIKVSKTIDYMLIYCIIRRYSNYRDRPI